MTESVRAPWCSQGSLEHALRRPPGGAAGMVELQMVLQKALLWLSGLTQSLSVFYLSRILHRRQAEEALEFEAEREQGVSSEYSRTPSRPADGLW